MSTQRNPQFIEDDLSEDAVHDYLEANPDFFERHGDLLGSLRIPHGSGAAVSLVERQISVLRQKDLKLERRLNDLIEVARVNDALATKMHRLTLHLIAAKDLSATLVAIETALRTGFNADLSVLVLFGDPAVFDDVKVGRFFKPIERETKSLHAFATFLKSANPRCGQVRDSQRDFLFGKETDEVGSAALVPLGKKSETGFLAIGSADANRFHPGMRMDFLSRLGDLVAEALRRF
jgi:uncharacterized protein YigA (DUF484 family)